MALSTTPLAPALMQPQLAHHFKLDKNKAMTLAKDMVLKLLEVAPCTQMALAANAVPEVGLPEQLAGPVQAMDSRRDGVVALCHRRRCLKATSSRTRTA